MVSIFDTGRPQPCPAPFNMAAYVLGMAGELESKPALEMIGGENSEIWSYSDILAAVQATAAGLREAGLSAGDRLLLRVGNHVDFPLAYLGAIWAGIVPVPTSTQLTIPEISYIAEQTAPAAILSESGIALPDPLPCMTIDLDSFRQMRNATATMPPDMGDPNRLAYIVFTSGTSGQPRGVRHAHRAIWARRMMFEAWYGIGRSDRVMHAGAFNWTYTLGTGLMDPWTVGATALIPVPDVKPEQLPDLIQDHDASIFAAAPGVYRRMLRDGKPLKAQALRHGLSAGEALPNTLRQLWQKSTGTDIHEALGMSECSTFISGSPDRPAGQDNSGFVQAGRRVAALGEDGQPVEHGTPGKLAIGTADPGLMLGYLDDDDVAGDWFVTGDMIQMTATGEVTYLGRGDDMLNAGGYRVSPLEVEAAFAGFAGLTEIACTQVEVKVDTWVIALFYTGDTPPSEIALRTHAQQLLAKYKQPRLYIPLKAMPKGGNGKLNRRILRDTFEAPK